MTEEFPVGDQAPIWHDPCDITAVSTFQSRFLAGGISRTPYICVMWKRLSLPGLTALAIGVFSFLGEFRYGLLSERMAQVGLSGLGAILSYTLGFLGTVVGVQQIATKALSFGKTATFIRNRVYFPTEGRVYLGMMCVLFIGAIVGKSNPLLLVFCLMATPWVFNGFIAFTQLRSISVSRTAPDRCEAGQILPIAVELANRRRFLPVWMFTVKDLIDGPIGVGSKMLRPLRPSVAFLRVAKQNRQRRVYRVRLPKRGRYEFGPMQVNTRFPLGLIERGLIIPDQIEILVHPRIGQLSPEWRQRLSRTREQVSRAQKRAGSFEDDFHRVREYQLGDDPRAIHWPTSARRGSLVVREFRESRDRPLAVLVDLWSADGEPTDGVELALDLAATLAVDHSRTSQRAAVYCSIGGREFTSWDSSSRTDLGGMLDAMAVAAPTTEDTLAKLVDVWRERQRGGERLVLVTTRREKSIPAELPPDSQWIEAVPEVVSAICEWSGDA